MHAFTPTPLEWRMLADAAAIMALEGPVETMQEFADLAVGCLRNLEAYFAQPIPGDSH
jgi:hypothetical protein